MADAVREKVHTKNIVSHSKFICFCKAYFQNGTQPRLSAECAEQQPISTMFSGLQFSFLRSNEIGCNVSSLDV